MIRRPVLAAAKRRHTRIIPHMQRYIYEFARRHNVRNMDTIDQMRGVAGEWFANGCVMLS